MSANSLSPAFIQLFYHSAFGVHVQTVPTLPYNTGSDEFDTWASGAIDAATMINDLVDNLVPFYPSTVTFDTYRIFTQEDADALPVLVSAGSFTSKVGTYADPGWTKAVQGTLSALADDGSKARLVFLDAASGNSFDAEYVSAGIITDLMDEWGDTAKGWSSRGDSKPATFLEYSKTLNEKLRREYRMF